MVVGIRGSYMLGCSELTLNCGACTLGCIMLERAPIMVVWEFPMASLL